MSTEARDRVPAEDTAVLVSHVGGEWRAGEGYVADVDPTHPDEPVAWSSRASAALTGEAVAAAAAAARQWARTTPSQRSQILLQAGRLFEERAAEIGGDLAREGGKPRAEGAAEARRAAQIMRYYAGQASEPDGHVIPSDSPTTLLYGRRVPLGVVAVITPWNFPVAIPAWKIAPALAYGNTVVWKPAELTPLTSVNIMRLLVDAGLPAGVVNLLLGSGAAIAEPLLADERIDAVTFTGSNEVGEGIAVAAARRGIKAQLELGGKNPSVVLADADLPHAARTIAAAAFMGSGQKCSATSRVIADRSVAAELTAALAAHADELTVGDPLDAEVEIGPVASRSQLETVRGYVDAGAADGSRASSRGSAELPSEGFFVAPTVFTDLPPSHAVLTEEIFGPVVAVVEADSYDEALALANGTEYGLTASIFTRDIGTALRFAEQAEVGVVKVNQSSSGVEPQAPFGGAKASGQGPKEQGKAAAEFFTQWKSVYIDRVEP